MYNTLTGFAQSNSTSENNRGYVIFHYTKNHAVRMELASAPAIEYVNGQLNLAFTSADGAMVQLVGLYANAETDSVFRSPTVTMVYITPGHDSTYRTDNKRLAPKIKVTTAKIERTKPITIHSIGRLYRNKQSVVVELYFSGNLPPQTHQTNTKTQ